MGSNEIIQALIKAVGEQNTVIDPRLLEEISRTCIPYRQYPDAVVYPTSSEQVQAILDVARRFGIPVWPVSIGKNWGYGEKSACYPGGITMVLERMNRILHVDEELAYAVIEPGVTYKQLDEYLKSNGIALWVDAPGTTKDASVIGNALDKGRGLTPYADHFGCLCGLEVVLPEGQIFRTGAGFPENNLSWNTYKWGVGPYLEGLFAQSNLGIVVKAGIWLMPEPESFDFLSFEYTADDAKFPSFVDDLRRLVSQGAIRAKPHVANDFAMLCIVSQYPYDLLKSGETSLGPEALCAWRMRHGVAKWTFGCGLYGAEVEVKSQRSVIRKTLKKYGTVRLLGAIREIGFKGKILSYLTPWTARFAGKSEALLESMGPAIDLFKGIPTDYFVKQVYCKSHPQKPSGDIDPARDECGFIWIAPMAPFTAKDVQRVLDTARPIYETQGFDFFVELIIESARSVILLLGVLYDRKNEDETARAKALYGTLREALIGKGYPPYRETAGSTMNALDPNPILKQFVGRIKTALDPTNILAPGRYGTPPFQHCGAPPTLSHPADTD